MIPGLLDKFHKFNLTTHEMVHFVSNINNYILVEVLESAWKIYIDNIRQAKDLDELIYYQEKFVKSILDKSLLSEKNIKLYDVLYKLIKRIASFVYI